MDERENLSSSLSADADFVAADAANPNLVSV